MKELLMLLAFAAAMVAVQASRGRGECHELIHDVMHKENMTEIIGSCMEENGIVFNLEGPGRGRRPGGRRGRNRGKRSPHMMRFISSLSEANQTALAECIFEKEDLLTDDGLFDATTFTEDLIAKLEEAEQTTQAEAMLTAIEDGVCVVEESEPNLMLVFDFIKCLKEVCKDGTGSSSEEA
ncbi:uncharacterized protein LOC119572280 isoform X2 [Penaeus monodon]|uniref:uncharacterized protein LOC119572280 isoform X2 n=2 Tax=Penaeus monodon TaxID=6687 RepID=UPI0018A6E2BC|nr:uncharacterized protein LOC119572280 isoform X2 [Penaeus monodon]